MYIYCLCEYAFLRVLVCAKQSLNLILDVRIRTKTFWRSTESEPSAPGYCDEILHCRAVLPPGRVSTRGTLQSGPHSHCIGLLSECANVSNDANTKYCVMAYRGRPAEPWISRWTYDGKFFTAFNSIFDSLYYVQVWMLFDKSGALAANVLLVGLAIFLIRQYALRYTVDQAILFPTTSLLTHAENSSPISMMVTLFAHSLFRNILKFLPSCWISNRMSSRCFGGLIYACIF